MKMDNKLINVKNVIVIQNLVSRGMNSKRDLEIPKQRKGGLRW